MRSLLLAAVLFSTVSASAQPVRFGVEGAWSRASFTGERPAPLDLPPELGPARGPDERALVAGAAGAFAEVPLRDRLWLHVGARYVPKGDVDRYTETDEGVEREETFGTHVDYVELPVLLRVERVAGPLNVSVGPFVAVKAREYGTAVLRLDGEREPGFADLFVRVADTYRDLDVGGVLAADVAWRRLRVGASMSLGVLDADTFVPRDAGGTWRGTRVLELTAALRLR